MEITDYTVEKVKDPFGILDGLRYEFMLSLELDEEDELYSPQGIYLRVVYKAAEENSGIIRHEIRERGTDELLDFELEDEELAEVQAFCLEHLGDANS